MTKKLRVTEPVSGKTKVLEIAVKRGWKAGTKITFDRDDGGKLTFVLSEKPHGWFQRRGNDLVWKCKLSARQVEKGVKLTIPMLDGEQLEVSTAPGEVHGGFAKRVVGKGMPIKGGPTRGDLIINFLIGRL